MKSWERLFVGAFGALLSSIGVYAFLYGSASPGWRYLGGGVLGALGLNAVYCAITGKRSWISRIGPLP